MKILALLTVLAVAAVAQPTQQVVFVSSDPTGNCANLGPLFFNFNNGHLTGGVSGTCTVISSSGGTGTVTSAAIAATANQTAVSGTCTITTTGTCTIGLVAAPTVSAANMSNLPITLTTTGSSGAATWTQSTNTLNIPQYSGGAGITYPAGTGFAIVTGGAAWGTTLTDPLTGTHGGTGVNNGASTITLAGNLTTTGAFNATFALGGTATFTMPTTSQTIPGLGKANTWSTGLQDFSAATWKIPTATTNTASATNMWVYDSTNSNLHGFFGGADGIALGIVTTPTTGHCPQFSVTSSVVLIVDSGSSNCGGGGSTAWSAISNATGALTLVNAGNATTFNQTSGVAWTWANTTAAIVSASQSSPIINLLGTEWHSSASAAGGLTVQFVPGTGLDAASSLNFAHTGTATGQMTYNFAGGPLSVAGDGVHAGIDAIVCDTTLPALVASQVNLIGANAAGCTAYGLQFPTAVAAGAWYNGAPSSSVSAINFGNLPATVGGTGVANSVANTLTFSGNFGLTVTLTGTTSVTFPPSGTLVGSADTGTVTNAMLAGSIAHSKIAATAVTPGSYTNTNLTVGADGSLTAASNGSGGGGSSVPAVGPEVVNIPDASNAAANIITRLPGITQVSALNTAVNCASGASPAVCTSAPSGAVAIPAGVNSTLVVQTTAVTAASRIVLTLDDSLTLSATTCNTTAATLAVPPYISARTAGTSFTISYLGTITANPVCLSYHLEN